MNAIRIALLLLLVPAIASAQARDPLAGAWEMTASKNLTTGAASPPQTPPLRVIFADGYYIQLTAAAGRQKITTPTADMTKEQLLDRYRLQGQHGTYTVNGKNLTRRTLVAVLPSNEGREGTSEFRVEGDVLIITRPTADKQTVEERFRRLKGGK